jgi:hypothetical protein
MDHKSTFHHFSIKLHQHGNGKIGLDTYYSHYWFLGSWKDHIRELHSQGAERMEDLRLGE